MQRLSESEKARILALSRQHVSLAKISAILRKKKSTIYYHVRKHFGRKISQIEIDDEPNARLEELLGVFATDGNFYVDKKSYHYRLTIVLFENQRAYAKKLAGMVARVLGKMPNIRANKTTTLW